MPVKNYEVVIRARLTNTNAEDPTLVATATAATCIVDSIVVNGVEKPISAGGFAAELTTLTAAVKQGLVDLLD